MHQKRVTRQFDRVALFLEMCFQNLEVRADPPRQFQISFPSEMFKQLLPKDRLRIIREGQKQLDADGRVNLRKLSRDLELNRITVSLWWNRRHELDETGALLPRWAGNSGRPKHKSFRTRSAVSVGWCTAQRHWRVPAILARLLD